jgi:hypothetical protein
MSILVVNVGTPLLSEVTQALNENDLCKTRPVKDLHLFVKARVKDDRTHITQEIYLHKSGIESLGFSRDMIHYDSMQELLGHRIRIASFFARLQFPQNIVRAALKIFTKVNEPADHVKNFLRAWGFQDKVIEYVEKAECLNLLALMQKLDLDFARSDGLPANFLSDFFPLPSVLHDDKIYKGYKLLLQKAQLRHSGTEESHLLGKSASLIKPLSKAQYISFCEENKEMIIELVRYFGDHKRKIKTLFLLGLFDTVSHKFKQHKVEIARIVFKLGADPVPDFLRILSKDDYQEEWMLFQAAFHDIIFGNNLGLNELNHQFHSWLETSTYFLEIAAKLSPAEKNLKEKQFKTAFLIAENNLFKSKGYAVPVRLSDGSDLSYIAYKTKENKTSLCGWSGRWNKLENSHPILGQGTYGLVQKVQCLGTGQLMALKAPLLEGCLDERKKTIMTGLFQNEIRCLRHFSQRSKCFNQLFAVVQEEDMIAYMREYREMDLIDAMLNIDNYEVTFDGIYRGFLDILHAFELLAQYKQAHYDIKGNNVLCDYDSSIKGFKCYVDDFGISRSYAKIRQSKPSLMYPSSIWKTDLQKLQALSSQKCSKDKFDLLVEKVEVSALGIMFYSLLTGTNFVQSYPISWNDFKEVHGDKMTLIMMKMICDKIDKRMTFHEAARYLEAHLEDEEPSVVQMRNRPFTSSSQEKALKRERLIYANP